jgi:pimeloyl-ACP methyl ester carboxylesterase
MQRVRSKDGTMIAMDRSGRGPALVLITGACTDRSSTKALASGLAERYTVYEFDRRGRGDSDQAGPYAIEREVEDLAAVIDAAGGSAYGFGHSSGGALALEAAARGVPLRAVVVYEPPFTTGPNDDLADELDQLAGAGRNSEACARFLALFTPQPVIDRMKTGLYWAHMTADAPTLAHEVRLSNNGTVPTDRLAKITVPVLALAGRDSPAWAREVADALAKAVPNSQSRVLADQPHGVADAGADPSAARSLQLTDTAPPSGCLGREPTAVLSAFSSSEAENLAVTARERNRSRPYARPARRRSELQRGAGTGAGETARTPRGRHRLSRVARRPCERHEGCAARGKRHRLQSAPLVSRLRGHCPIGSADHCAELLSRYAEAGCQRVYLRPLGDEPRQIDSPPRSHPASAANTRATATRLPRWLFRKAAVPWPSGTLVCGALVMDLVDGGV